MNWPNQAHQHGYVRQNPEVAHHRQTKIKIKMKMKKRLKTAPFNRLAVQFPEVQQWKEKVDHVRHVAKTVANRQEVVQVCI